MYNSATQYSSFNAICAMFIIFIIIKMISIFQLHYCRCLSLSNFFLTRIRKEFVLINLISLQRTAVAGSELRTTGYKDIFVPLIV